MAVQTSAQKTISLSGIYKATIRKFNKKKDNKLSHKIIKKLNLIKMRKKTRFLMYPILIMGVFLIVASSCKKDNKIGNTPSPNNAQTFTDSRDGTVYKYVKIGNQYWMAENLKYLPSVNDSITSSNTNYSYSTPYYYVYEYFGTDVNAAKATANYATYGVLYSWTAACSSCPDGWHLPSDAEWEVLINNLGGSSLACGKLKSKSGWHNNGNGTDEVGFSALPGGFGMGNRRFSNIGLCAFYWSATDYSQVSAHLKMICNEFNNWSESKYCGMSVRCIKN